MKHWITVQGSGHRFRCSEDQHLLQGMQQMAFEVSLQEPIPVGCRGGGCGICRIRVLSGIYETRKMSGKHVTEEMLAQGIVLACRICPRSELEIAVLSPQEGRP
ncbi:2Fe-2S iron-sulfur cluster-binding protein [Haliea sp.]